jgi:hypothetical protein
VRAPNTKSERIIFSFIQILAAKSVLRSLGRNQNFLFSRFVAFRLPLFVRRQDPEKGFYFLRKSHKSNSIHPNIKQAS